MDFSFQLYSARNFPPLDDVLGRLARLGYKQVEGFGGLYADASGLAASLKKHGLTMPTGHFGLAQLKDTPAALKIAETLGMDSLLPRHSWGRPEPGREQWVELAETLAKLGETIRKAGFGWMAQPRFQFVPTRAASFHGHHPRTASNNDWEMDVAGW
jgi:sugar phosphate isomerase/epimerase